MLYVAAAALEVLSPSPSSATYSVLGLANQIPKG